jgi:flagellar biosynthesis chaperone FliJ
MCEPALERYRQELKRWEEEYRCYGPQGSIEPRKSGMTKAKIVGLRNRIERLDTTIKQRTSEIDEYIGAI